MTVSRFHRVFLQTTDEDSLVTHLPLFRDGTFDTRGRRPILFRSEWDRELYFGELESLSGAQLIRWHEGPPSLTTLDREPLQVGTKVVVFYSESPDDEMKEFIVRDISEFG